MAVPMTADQFVQALRSEGLSVTEHAGWRTHNRAGHGAWGPMNGVMIHHTAGSAPSDGQIVYSGRSDLPGPCAHSYLAKSGVVTMTGNGRANHAGTGDTAVLNAVINESYGTAPPATHKHDGSSGGSDGNSHFYGLEVSNLGTKADAYPAVQYAAAVKWAAAICRFHGWSAKSVIGHKEWSDWKPDPIYSMPQFRKDVQALLDKKPGASAPGVPPQEEDPMAGITKQDIFSAVWSTDAVAGPSDAADHKTNPTWQPQSILKDVQARVRSMDVRTAAMSAAVTSLAGQLGKDVDTATVVAAVEKAIADAVVKVDVDVTGANA